MRRAPVAYGTGCGTRHGGTIVTAQQNPAPAPQRLEPGPMSPITTGATRTFTKDVAPILYKNCTGCHRPGTVAPMSLLTYKDARPGPSPFATRSSMARCRRGTPTRRSAGLRTHGC